MSEHESSDKTRPVIVCLCGSTRFYRQFQEANYQETMAGRIVLSVGFYPQTRDEAHGEGKGCTPKQKIKLDELHKRKIDLADEILVLNVDGYVGDSTRSEILHAVSKGKRVRWLEPLNIPRDLKTSLNIQKYVNEAMGMIFAYCSAVRDCQDTAENVRAVVATAIKAALEGEGIQIND